jgi:multidrug efflux pump subunit AcrB
MEKKNDHISLLRQCTPWMTITAVSGTVFILFTLYRLFQDRYFVREEMAVLITLFVAMVFVARYVLLLFTQRALSGQEKTDKEKLDRYYARYFAFWLMEGIIYLVLFGLFMLIVLEEYRYI